MEEDKIPASSVPASGSTEPPAAPVVLLRATKASSASASAKYQKKMSTGTATSLAKLLEDDGLGVRAEKSTTNSKSREPPSVAIAVLPGAAQVSTASGSAGYEKKMRGYGPTSELANDAKPGAYAESSQSTPNPFGKQTPAMQMLPQTKRQERYGKKMTKDDSSKEDAARIENAKPGAQPYWSHTKPNGKEISGVENPKLAQKRQERYEKKMTTENSTKQEVVRIDHAKPGAQPAWSNTKPKGKEIPGVENLSISKKRQERYEKKMTREDSRMEGVVRTQDATPGAQPALSGNMLTGEEIPGLVNPSLAKMRYEKKLKDQEKEFTEALLANLEEPELPHRSMAEDNGGPDASDGLTLVTSHVKSRSTSYQSSRAFPDVEQHTLPFNTLITEEQMGVNEADKNPVGMLIEATLVDDMEEDRRENLEKGYSRPLVMAQAMEEDIGFCNKRNLAVGALAVMAAVGLAVGVTCGTGACKANEEKVFETIYVNITDAPTAHPSESPTVAPTPAPTLPPLKINGLPPYSLTALQTPESPQYKAYDWILKDPNLQDYLNDRRVQRFALATIAYATEYDAWTNNRFWLSYDHDECQWYSTTNLDEYPEYEGNPCSQNFEYQYLTLNYNGLEGSIPPEVGLLSSLRILDLAGSSFTGTIPTEVGTLHELYKLWLSDTGLSGTIPLQISTLTSLQNLYLFENELTGPIPSEISSITPLLELIVYDNELTGSLPSELGALKLLYELYCYWNKLNGTIPTELGLLAALEQIRLDENQLSGTIPSELGALTLLGRLELAVNQLSGAIPSELGALTALTHLILYTNSFSGKLPTMLGVLSNLQFLELDTNQFNGAIPSELGQLSYLSFLDLDDNSLSSTIPTELGLLRAVFSIHLENNNLSGRIPSEFGFLSMIHSSVENDEEEDGIVKLAGNMLTGPIPTELGLVTKMTGLLLGRNQLTSTIPTELGNLVSLQELDLHGNNLEGSTETLSSLSNTLKILLLHDNDGLTGTVPDSLCSLETIESDCADLLCGCGCPCRVVATNSTSMNTTKPPAG